MMSGKYVVTVNGGYSRCSPKMLRKVIQMGDAARCADADMPVENSVYYECTVEPYTEPPAYHPTIEKFFNAIGSRDPNELLTEIGTLNQMLTQARNERDGEKAIAGGHKQTIGSLNKQVERVVKDRDEHRHRADANWETARQQSERIAILTRTRDYWQERMRKMEQQPDQSADIARLIKERDEWQRRFNALEADMKGTLTTLDRVASERDSYKLYGTQADVRLDEKSRTITALTDRLVAVNNAITNARALINYQF